MGARLVGLRMLSKERSLSQMNWTRLVNGCSSLRNSFNQYFSRGELPITTAMVLVRGNTCKIFSIIPGRSRLDTDSSRVGAEAHIPEASLVQGGEKYRDIGQQTLAMTC